MEGRASKRERESVEYLYHNKGLISRGCPLAIVFSKGPFFLNPSPFFATSTERYISSFYLFHSSMKVSWMRKIYKKNFHNSIKEEGLIFPKTL